MSRPEGLVAAHRQRKVTIHELMRSKYIDMKEINKAEILEVFCLFFWLPFLPLEGQVMLVHSCWQQ